MEVLHVNFPTDPWFMIEITEISLGKDIIQFDQPSRAGRNDRVLPLNDGVGELSSDRNGLWRGIGRDHLRPLKSTEFPSRYLGCHESRGSAQSIPTR